MEPQPWEQMPGEPDAAHSHFLTYLYMTYLADVPRRRVGAAYCMHHGLPEGTHPPQAWSDEVRLWRWHYRATRYDIANRHLAARAFVAEHMQALRAILLVSVNALLDPKNAPKSHYEARESIRAVSEIVTPEVLAALLADPGGAGTGEPGRGGEPEFLAEVPEGAGPLHAGGAGGGPVGEAAGDSPAADDPAV